MRHRYIILIIFTSLFCISPALFSQSETQNYIVKRVMLDKNGVSYIDKIDYFDGLGRPVQTVMKGASPSGKDIVTLQEYDALGRAWRSWLPAPAGDSGGYVDIPSFQTAVTDFYTDAHPYSKPVYDGTPLNRIKEQFGPGADWHYKGKRVINAWHTNDEYDMRCLSYEVTSCGSLLCNGYYSYAQLYVTQVTDEDGNISYTFTDKLDRVVLTRQIENGKNHDTYYVYDDFGQLRYVLPPLASDELTDSTATWDMATNQALRDYAYYYKYDERGNCILKKIPGRDEIRMVYDKAERLVLSQDGNQRRKNKWTVNKYDTFGRLLYTAEILNDESWAGLLDYFKEKVIVEYMITGTHQNPMSDTGYSCDYYHLATTKLFTVNYYDNYEFLELLPSQVEGYLKYQPIIGYDAQYSNAKGLLTGTRVYSLSDNTYTTEAIYYDDKANVVQSRATNNMGGYEIAYNKYDFSGNILKTLKTHSATKQPSITEYYSYHYDHAGRLTNTYYKLNNLDSVLLAGNIYDEIGRLKEKKRHGVSDTEYFNYNLRGWTTYIKSGSFEENIYYNKVPSKLQGATPCYNGNISATSWTYNNTKNAYAYTYDALNRLKRADCYLNNASQTSESMRESFAYDKMGNITFLSRSGRDAIMDKLIIVYDGNRVKSVIESAISSNRYSQKEYLANSNSNEKFRYDANGNTTADLDRDIVTIRYNLLNLPELIQFRNGNQIVNSYDASGRKLKSRFRTCVATITVPIGEVSDLLSVKKYRESGTYYCGNYEYIFGGPSRDTVLCKIHNSEGYKDGQDINNDILHYYRRDHLGNVREVWKSGSPAQTVQRMQYYPSGLPWADCMGADYQNRKYNGKEFIEMHGYDSYDYHARHMFAALMRFTTIDPLAEVQPNKTPYHFCSNNPITRIDPTGMLDGDYYDRDGVYLGNDGIDDNKVYQLKDNYRAKFENTDVNWGGTLSEKHYTELQTKSNDLGTVQDAFVTGDAVSDKRIQSLHPSIRMQATDFIKEANAGSGGTLIRVAQGFRTYAEQDALYAQGRTAPGNIVTKAKGGFSNHNFGLAFDIVGITNGKLDYNLDWKSLSTLGKSKGFEWGGDWKFKDKPHFENMFGNSLKNLRALPKDKKGLPILKP